MQKKMSSINLPIKYYIGKNEVSTDNDSRNKLSSIGYKPIYDKKGGYLKYRLTNLKRYCEFINNSKNNQNNQPNILKKRSIHDINENIDNEYP